MNATNARADTKPGAAERPRPSPDERPTRPSPQHDAARTATATLEAEDGSLDEPGYGHGV